MDRIEAHLRVESPQSKSVDMLKAATGLSNQRIKLAMTQGAVWVTRGRNTQRLRRSKRALKPGDEIHIYYDAEILAQVAPQATLIADLGGYSVWNKPYGMRSQGSKWGDHCTLVRWAERHLQPERSAFTVHRLDRAANGLMLVAHSKSIAAALSSLFEKRDVQKQYRALVHGDLSAQPNPLRIQQPIDDKEGLTEVSLLRLLDNGSRSLLDVRIETGRKHQIRRHLAGLGHAVVGDRLYGSGREDQIDLQLTAFMLAFHCPVQDKPVEFRLSNEGIMSD